MKTVVEIPAAADVIALVPLDCDPTPVVRAMRAEGLPEAFAQSLERGVWTTCAAILPPLERAVADRYTPLTREPVPPSPVPDERHAAAAQSD